MVPAVLATASDLNAASPRGAFLSAIVRSRINRALVLNSALLSLACGGEDATTGPTLATLAPADLCTASPGTVIATFEDRSLEEAVRRDLGVGNGDALSCELLSGLTSLNASALGITSLVGAQNLTGLTSLLLQGNPNLIDVQSLIDNTGIGPGDSVNLVSTDVSCANVAKLQVKGATVLSDCVARIAFSSARDGNFEIYVMDADGSNPVNHTNNAADDFSPAWSPDGSMIAFSSDRDGNSEIYVMDADGSNPINRTIHGADDFSPAWAPDGSKIAFSSDRDGNFEIYVMNVDGTNQVNRTNAPNNDFSPEWSPNGLSIAFQSDRNGNQEVYVMDAYGSNQVNRTNTLDNEFSPAWSRDGSGIAFWSDREGNREIFVMDSDPVDPVHFTFKVALGIDPAWSPDGSTIAFMSDRDGNNQIYVVQADSSNLAKLTDTGLDEQPAWALVR